MTGSAGRLDFFGREAGDYLRELAALIAQGPPPPGDAFSRLSRALRGAAMLAGPAGFTRAARELEQIARLVRDGQLSWAGAGPGLREAVAEFQRLLGFARTWDDARDQDAEALARRLQALAGAEAPSQPGQPAGSETGLQSFVGREGELVAHALDDLARSLAEDPAGADSRLAEVERAMQSLHGVAGLGELAPLDDLIDALVAIVAELRRHPSVPPDAAEVLRAGAAAIRQLAGTVAAGGRPRTLEATDVFVARLYDGFVLGEGTVPVDRLLLAGGAAEAARSAPPPAIGVDLASLGDRLRFGAAQLRAATSSTARRLRGFTLLTAIRAAPGGLGRRPAGAFLQQLAGLLEQGGATDDSRLIDVIDQAGEAIASGTGVPALERLLAGLVPQRGDDTIVPIESLAPSSPLEAEEAVVPIESLAPSEPGMGQDDIVPIERLLATKSLPLGAEVVPIESLAPADLLPPPPATPPGIGRPADRTRLERTLTAYSQLVARNAPVLPLEALVPPAVAPRAVPGSRSAAVEVEAEFDVVSIDSLLYRGRGAMDRADAVRHQLDEAMRAASNTLELVEPLVRELLDLVPLAIADSR